MLLVLRCYCLPCMLLPLLLPLLLLLSVCMCVLICCTQSTLTDDMHIGSKCFAFCMCVSVRAGSTVHNAWSWFVPITPLPCMCEPVSGMRAAHPQTFDPHMPCMAAHCTQLPLLHMRTRTHTHHVRVTQCLSSCMHGHACLFVRVCVRVPVHFRFNRAPNS